MNQESKVLLITGIDKLSSPQRTIIGIASDANKGSALIEEDYSNILKSLGKVGGVLDHQIISSNDPTQNIHLYNSSEYSWSMVPIPLNELVIRIINVKTNKPS